MEWFWYIYVFVIGITLGSFYNVVGLRLPAGESLVFPRSHCPVCKKTLKSFDLIPVLSYIFLRGKCRQCQTRISPIYPSAEFLTGLLFLLSYWQFGFSWELSVALLFVSLLVIITVSDLTKFLILDKVLIFFFLPIVVLRHSFAPLDPWWDGLAGATAGFTTLLVIAIVSKGGMGGGDIKLYGVIGFVLGVTNVFLSLFLAALLGSIVGMFGMLKKKYTRKSALPFGPFIALGSVAAYFFGEEMINLYLSWMTSFF